MLRKDTRKIQEIFINSHPDSRNAIILIHLFYPFHSQRGRAGGEGKREKEKDKTNVIHMYFFLFP